MPLRLRVILASAIAVVVVLCVFLFRPRPEHPGTGNAGRRPAPPSPSVGVPPSGTSATPAEQVRLAITDALASGQQDPATSPFPAGTRLVSVKVAADLATLELSPEFAAAGKQGDTGESMAQRALRAALSNCSGIRRMTVLVEGRTFEGEHSGPWTDLPIQDDAENPS